MNLREQANLQRDISYPNRTLSEARDDAYNDQFKYAAKVVDLGAKIRTLQDEYHAALSAFKDADRAFNLFKDAVKEEITK